MLGFFVKLFSGRKLITNARKSVILDVTMALDTSPCFFKKPSNAPCFIIYFNFWSQIRALWKYCHVQREMMKKIWQFVNFGAGNSCHWVRSMKKEYRNFPFLHDSILKQNYILGKCLSELYWILLCF